MKSLLIGFLTIIIAVFVSCSSNDGDNRSGSLTSYFFPQDSIEPYIYVYADEKRPVDEKFYRIYTLKTKEKHHLVVERFNANFRITEGYTYDLDDSLNVVDHMIVDAYGKKRRAHLSEDELFPLSFENPSIFISDFPAHIDSLMGVYKSKKRVIDSMDYSLFDSSTSAIKVVDDVTLSFVNPSTQEGSSNSVEIHRIYAKGFGLTEWYTPDEKVHFKLKRILSNDWWKEHAQ